METDRNQVKLRELIELVRAHCLSLPEVTEKETWGDPTWRVRSRIFTMQKGNGPRLEKSLWIKADPTLQKALIRQDGRKYFSPPYLGHKGWLGIHLSEVGEDFNAVSALIDHSYELVAPKKLARQLRASEKVAQFY